MFRKLAEQNRGCELFPSTNTAAAGATAAPYGGIHGTNGRDEIEALLGNADTRGDIQFDSPQWQICYRSLSAADHKQDKSIALPIPPTTTPVLIIPSSIAQGKQRHPRAHPSSL